mmetsp:Transcript_35849/g.72814  ORF Transcript_35849/g.72814 Transcript_35849/m.72814 type:complete len:353 (+) Transcript_35849:183-1241(+)
MSAATTIANAFGESANLYTEVLALSASGPSVPHAQIRRAYYKRALLYHPDKQDPSKLSAEQIEDAKAKFQAVSVAYNILSNEESRAEYDETGELYDEDDDNIGGNKSGTDAWTEYFSGIFGKVTVDDIDKFESQYKCSEEEEKDVLEYYARFKGDLNKCLECVMCSREEDKKRWVDDYINPAVKRGEVEEYTDEIERTVGGGGGGEDENEEMSEEEEDEEATETESDSEEEKKASPKNEKQKKKKKKSKQQAKKSKGKKPPAKKASKAKTKRKSGGSAGVDEDLIAAIRGNAVARSKTSFESMMAGLEDRYGGGGKKKKGGGGEKRKKKKADPDDIPDDEFERIRASLGHKK